MSDLKKQLEHYFETILWKTRIITLLPVIFSLVSAFALFVAGSLKIIKSIVENFSLKHTTDYHHLLGDLIGAVDLYLIGIVLLIFSFGIYELFISKIDPAQNDKEINILEIKDLEDLKNRLLKVIVMALIVHFFKTVLDVKFTTTLEMLYLAGAILMISASTHFIRKTGK